MCIDCAKPIVTCVECGATKRLFRSEIKRHFDGTTTAKGTYTGKFFCNKICLASWMRRKVPPKRKQDTFCGWCGKPIQRVIKKEGVPVFCKRLHKKKANKISKIISTEFAMQLGDLSEFEEESHGDQP